MLTVVQHTNALCGQSVKTLNFKTFYTYSCHFALTGLENCNITLVHFKYVIYLMICFFLWNINSCSVTHNLFYLKTQFTEGYCLLWTVHVSYKTNHVMLYEAELLFVPRCMQRNMLGLQNVELLMLQLLVHKITAWL